MLLTLLIKLYTAMYIHVFPPLMLILFFFLYKNRGCTCQLEAFGLQCCINVPMNCPESKNQPFCYYFFFLTRWQLHSEISNVLIELVMSRRSKCFFFSFFKDCTEWISVTNNPDGLGWPN